ncbi:MAG: hypothetical protein KDI38_28080, partial [Calditrichaeota bacterium]|nr:hypothetical protein [Calditrichota bacterium]
MTRIARAPFGGDFNIKPRPAYRGHSFFGGNAFMLDLLADNREELGVEADADLLRRGALATRRQLAEKTARAMVENARIEDGHARFDVRVINMTGHKLPTGYPSRRLWLMVEVLDGRERVFVSGAVDERGRIVGLEQELGQPHVDRVTSPKDVPIWETIVLDGEGKITTRLASMAAYA